MITLVETVDVRVVGDGLEGDVGHGLVDEAGLESFVGVLEGVVIEAGGHQPHLGQGDGDAGGVAGDPAAAPLLGDVGGGATPTGRV